MNPGLARLQPYPFERLAGLRAGLVPNPALAPINLSIGEPQHPTPQLVLDALVAACLILYPRYQDPLTLLPCTPELLLDRLAEPARWPPLPPARRAYLAWWRLQGQWLKCARATGLWRR